MSTGYASPYVSQWLAVIGGLLSHCSVEKLFSERLFSH